MPADAAAEGVADDADVRRRPGERGQPVLGGRGDDVHPQRAGLGPRDAGASASIVTPRIADGLEQDRAVERAERARRCGRCPAARRAARGARAVSTVATTSRPTRRGRRPRAAGRRRGARPGGPRPSRGRRAGRGRRSAGRRARRGRRRGRRRGVGLEVGGHCSTPSSVFVVLRRGPGRAARRPRGGRAGRGRSSRGRSARRRRRRPRTRRGTCGRRPGWWRSRRRWRR